MNKQTILLVEDNEKLNDGNRRMLEAEGYKVLTAKTIAEAREQLSHFSPDIILLDIGLPDGSGLDFLEEYRLTSDVPVLMLTGYGETADIVKGFNDGCDDYLTKPYTFTELLVRLQRLLKNAERVPEKVSRGLLTLRIASREAFVGSDKLDLTPREYALLQFFVQNEGRIMQIEYIYETVWGQPMAGDSQAISSAVSRLRKKLKGCGYTISAEYRTGYCFESGES